MPPSQAVTRYALAGRIVTMDDHATVLNDGVLYVANDEIAAVQTRDAPPPVGFENAVVIDSRGTLYPGLIELHNHLSYNVLPLWPVPQRFSNRSQWKNHPRKRALISGPMQVLVATTGFLEAIVRYVECKCLLGGTTTSQGLTLMGASGIERQYRGLVRNPEQPDRADLPAAGHRVDDIEDAGELKAALAGKSCYLLHLSEGVDESARQHFLNLQLPDGQWAITNALAGIHAAGLTPADLEIFGALGGSVIWSPLSNLLLYHDTAKIRAAKEHGVPIALGSDWSPSGSKNLLGELKIARLYSTMQEGIFSDLELVRMATRTPAQILKWGHCLGSLEAGKIADILVVSGHSGDPYTHLLTRRESDIQLVVIDGVPRYGLRRWMLDLGRPGEQRLLNGRLRILHLGGAPDAELVSLPLSVAQERLANALQNLPQLAQALAAPQAMAAAGLQPLHDRVAEHGFQLVLDNDDDLLRPLTPLPAEDVGIFPLAQPLEEIVQPMTLDELTVAEAPQKYFDQINTQLNLPEAIKTGLARLYRL
jgi:5-methylthioadenosine/S-adenosylhomocysteine deaminase